jgi:NDP-sugar pyrophosphorylase family protein
MRMVVLAAGNGCRLASVTQGRPKQLLDVGGHTLLDRLLGLGRELGLQALVVTRQVHAASFAAALAASGAGAGAELMVIEETPDMLASLYRVRDRVREDFVFAGGDTLLVDPAPLRELIHTHLAERPYGSYLVRRSAQHKMKMQPLQPVPRLVLTHDGGYPYSLPLFAVQRADSLADLAIEPRGEYLQRALDRGERLRFQEHTSPLFEIDTPEDLTAARRFFS